MQCKTCGRYWDEKTPPPFEVSEDGLVKCPDCMTTKDLGLEQKIKDRIAELENSFDMNKDAKHQQRVYYGIDELRKLLK